MASSFRSRFGNGRMGDLVSRTSSCGKTEEEALENILEAIELYLEHSDIKLDSGVVIREVTV